jgi:hypothetical protein
MAPRVAPVWSPQVGAARQKLPNLFVGATRDERAEQRSRPHETVTT